MHDYDGPDEYPIASIPPIEAWSENYALEIACPRTGAALLYSSGRLPLDPTIWRELIMLQLPGGRNFFFKGFGRVQNPHGAGGALIDYEVLEPGRVARLRFDGPVYACDPAELVARGTYFDTYFRCRIDIRVEGVSPVWDMKGKTTEAATMAGSSHLEQICQASGVIELDGSVHPIDSAYTIRDHSRGVRDLSHYGGHNWLNGAFPSGRSFFIYAMKAADGVSVGMAEAAVTQDDKLYKARILHTDFIDGNHWGQSHRLILGSELGEMSVEFARPIACFPIGLLTPFDTCPGSPLSYDTGMSFDEPMVLRWDGQEGVGWSERGWAPGAGHQR
ncbi:hypothetical protein SAMN02927924_02282 [Sphingobium faniae]|nr:hypothetical protein SAMN02927924_02282 [Sphingobium faniae]